MSQTLVRHRAPIHERLRRMLFLVPFISRHQGLAVEEVATELGISKEELLADFDLLTLVGRPPFQPDDFVDIYVEDNRVYVDLDQRLSAPPRLTVAEGVALASAAELMRPAAGDALSAALQKLERVLPPMAGERFREMNRKIDLSSEAPIGLTDLARAISEHREVLLEYYTLGRGETEARRVQPNELRSHRGVWYLSAYCLTRKDDRLFRVDRILNLQVTGETFVADNGRIRNDLLRIDQATTQVKVQFSETAAPYVRELFGGSMRERADGTAETMVSGDSKRWLTGWILSFGGEAKVVEPPWAVEAVAEAAQAVLQK